MQVADTRRAADPVQVTSRAPARAPAEGTGQTAVSESRAGTGDGRPLPEHHAYSSIDHAFKANLARLTVGLSPAVLAEQTFDWLVHLAISPGKQGELMEKWFRKAVRFGMYAPQNLTNPDTPPCISPLPQDRRFEGAGWQHWPYNLLHSQWQTWLAQHSTARVPPPPMGAPEKGYTPHQDARGSYVRKA